MGIALGLRLIAHSKLAASDPEIDDILKKGECDSSPSISSGSSSPPAPASLFESPASHLLDASTTRQMVYESQSRKSYEQRARERRKRRVFRRADSDTQSDYILEADPFLLEQMRSFGSTTAFSAIVPFQVEDVVTISTERHPAGRIRPDTPRPSPTKSKESSESYE